MNFKLDSPVVRVLEKICDMLILTVLWTICSLPIITMGAATTAMYYVALKIVRDEDEYTLKSYAVAFKTNFWQATKIWVLFLLTLLIVAADLYYVFILLEVSMMIRQIIITGSLILLFLWLSMFVYVFPLQARFKNSTKRTIINALILSFSNMPITIGMLILDIISIYISLKMFPFIGVPLVVGINSILLHKVFDKYVS